MRRFVFYGHGGSGNHGCEAIVRSTVAMIPDKKVLLVTDGIAEDEKYHIDQVCELAPQVKHKIERISFQRVYLALARRITGNQLEVFKAEFGNLFSVIEKTDIAVSIGGDNYCYAYYAKVMAGIHQILTDQKIPTVLWGCSVEPTLLKNPAVVADMKRYSLITARESLTYDALFAAGISKNVHLLPDPAFTLETQSTALPAGFVPGRTIGLNVSHLIQKYEKHPGVTMKNVEELVRYLLADTDFAIALIPHVVWEDDNDLDMLNTLYETFKESDRVIKIEDHNCMELKWIISQCRMFVAARTHATVAAYSSCVPTIALGYSVKARGIAKDIFGDIEDYVISVNDFVTIFELKKAFMWLTENEDSIRTHLEKVMPAYIQKAKKSGLLLNQIMEEFHET